MNVNAMSQQNKKVKGSLPCGNPQRFESSDVIKMTKKRKSEGLCEVEMESEKHIKTMVQSQINVDTTFEEQFSQHRAFTAASAYDPSADKLVGIHDFNQHKQVNELDSKVEYFRQCGLDEDEILLMLKKEKDEANSDNSKSYGPDPAMKQKWIDEIEKKIALKEECLKKPDTFKGGLELSRQSLDLEKSIALQQNKTSILPSGILTQKKHLPSHPDDPINHIPEIIKVITPKPEREPRRDRRRRRKLHRQMLRQQLYVKDEENDSDEDDNSEEDTNNFHSQSISSSTHDVTLQVIDSDNFRVPYHPDVGRHQSSSCKNSHQTCTAQVSNKREENLKLSASTTVNSKTTDEKSIKEITTSITSIPEEEIVANRLSVHEIIGIEKFCNYQEGEPNNVIYVKNLPSDTNEEDLVALFGRYQTTDERKILFRLLSGRMKGQAFVTFPDETTAGQALSLLNGYRLRDKPIILSYGKRKVEQN